MTKIDIIAGFLGAGKTTLIKKMISEGAYGDEKLILVENEFGDVGIDAGFLKETGVQIRELTSGCICCTLAGDFKKALQQVIRDYAPDRIIIEPSGVAGLSDLAGAVLAVQDENISLGCLTTVVDISRAEDYLKEFGLFYYDQVGNAGTIILSHSDKLEPSVLNARVKMLRQINPDANFVTTNWDKLTGKQLLESIEQRGWMEETMKRIREEAAEHLHEHTHDEHHHHHDEHHHHHDEHHHHHDEHHHHDGEHHHVHADEVFDQIGLETAQEYTCEQIRHILQQLDGSDICGYVLRAKGMVAGLHDQWIFFDYIPGSIDVREGTPQSVGMICIIGTDLDESAVRSLFE